VPAGAPPSAVLDTSILVAGAIGRAGPSARILLALRAGRFHAITSPHLLDELVSVLLRPDKRRRTGFDLQDIANYRLFIRQHSRLVEGRFEVDMVPTDAKDNPVIATALEGHAGYIVTEDGHDLLPLKDKLVKGYHPIHVLRAADFLRHLGLRR